MDAVIRQQLTKQEEARVLKEVEKQKLKICQITCTVLETKNEIDALLDKYIKATNQQGELQDIIAYDRFFDRTGLYVKHFGEIQEGDYAIVAKRLEVKMEVASSCNEKHRVHLLRLELEERKAKQYPCMRS